MRKTHFYTGIIIVLSLFITLFGLILWRVMRDAPYQNPNNVMPTSTQSSCKVGGCSSQLCVEESDEGVSTCEYTQAYACYKSATCTRQQNGKCGWTETNELKACLSTAK